MNRLFVILIIVVKISANVDVPLAWDDPAHSDIGCTYPKAISFPQHLINALTALPQNFKLYLNMANSAYYRWQHQKVTGANFSTEADIKSLKPRLIFPNLFGLLPSLFSPLSLSYGKTLLLDTQGKFYKVWCTPTNLPLTNATCEVIDASEGSKSSSFGTGEHVLTTIIYADNSTMLEWHCFVSNDGVRDRQIFNVISIKETLTPTQIENMKKVVVSHGFKEDNVHVYDSY